MKLSPCDLCPRKCNADRTGGKYGVCASGSDVRIARAALHFYEEPCISGTRGSGTVFFTGCNLRCVYCQNYEISRGNCGATLSVQELADIFLRLQRDGAHNVNLVTPTHFALQIIEAVRIARGSGLTIPVVYNTGGYETEEAIRALRDTVDIYLTDFKYMDPALAKSLSGAEDYPLRAMEALREAVRQVEEKGGAVFDESGIMQRGVIVRHLVLPGHVKNSKAVIRRLHETFGDRIFLSIMNQYTPVRKIDAFPELNRRVTRREYDRVISYALDLGVQSGFFQEGATQSESFIPPFDGTGIPAGKNPSADS